jgi:hypothetical protein
MSLSAPHTDLPPRLSDNAAIWASTLYRKIRGACHGDAAQEAAMLWVAEGRLMELRHKAQMRVVMGGKK